MTSAIKRIYQAMLLENSRITRQGSKLIIDFYAGKDSVCFVRSVFYIEDGAIVDMCHCRTL